MTDGVSILNWSVSAPPQKLKYRCTVVSSDFERFSFGSFPQKKHLWDLELRSLGLKRMAYKELNLLKSNNANKAAKNAFHQKETVVKK